jgi:hypothetical protein
VQLARALSELAGSMTTFSGRIQAITQALTRGAPAKDVEPHLARMNLQKPTSLRDRLYQRLVSSALRSSRENS